MDVGKTLCRMLDIKKTRSEGQSYINQITYVEDRPGHDQRYAIEATKIANELGWKPEETFESGIEKTVNWYLANQDWVNNVTSGEYRNWVQTHYIERGEELA